MASGKVPQCSTGQFCWGGTHLLNDIKVRSTRTDDMS